MSAKQKILTHLQKGNTLTTAQAQRRFGIENVSARVDELRKEGYSIYTNTRNLGNGRKVYSYRLGKPSRNVIAAGVEYLRMLGVRAFA